MKTLKIASALLFTALSASAFASADDGNLDNAWLNKTPATQTQLVRQTPAPAPTASAGEQTRQDVRSAGEANLIDRAVTP